MKKIQCLIGDDEKLLVFWGIECHKSFFTTELFELGQSKDKLPTTGYLDVELFYALLDTNIALISFECSRAENIFDEIS